MIADSSKPNNLKLRNVYTIRSTTRNVTIQKRKRTSLHKGALVVPEYLNDILVAYNQIKRACTGGKFELNGLFVWKLWEIKVDGVIPYLFQLKEKIINFHYFYKVWAKSFIRQ